MGVEELNLEQLEERLIQIRRNLHAEPELSNEEYETTRKIKQWLSDVGIKVLDLPTLNTGVIAMIGTGEAPVIAIRADIDALPIDEESGVPFSSTVPGKMHACGHDFHSATIFGAAYLLKQQEERLQGTVKILFQPAEETGHGAKAVIASGALDDVEAIFGLHNSPDLAVGEWGTRPGALTAGVDRFTINVKGVGAHDNADMRLTPIGHEIGLIRQERYNAFLDKKEKVEQEIERLRKASVSPSQINPLLESIGSALIQDGSHLISILRRPEVSYEHIHSKFPSDVVLDEYMMEQVEIQVKYAGYIEKQLIHVNKLQKMEKKKIPDNIDYESVHGLAIEARQKLIKIRPISIGQASRISGVTPADISILLVYLEHYNRVTAAGG